MNHQVRIVAAAVGMGSAVFIDDIEIQPLRSFTLKVDMESTRLILEFAPCDVVVEGSVESIDEVHKR